MSRPGNGGQGNRMVDPTSGLWLGMARITVVLTTYLKYQGLVMVGKVTVL